MRLPFPRLSPAPFQALASMKALLEQGPLGRALAELVWTRVSQMNRCSYCVESHGKGLLAAGDSEERFAALSSWRDSPLFTAKEKAALAYTEALTNVQEAGAPDEVYQPLEEHFDDKAIVDLTLAIALLNAFNRVSIGMAA